MNRLHWSIAGAVAALTTLDFAMAAANATATPPDSVKLVDSFEAAGGKFEGYRRPGAKGICAMGEFVGSAEGRALFVAFAFIAKTVIVRFSVGSANPKAADNGNSQRNMALQ
jgi:catalase